MAKNDLILLDGILDERVLQKHPSDKRDEVFEFLAIEEILKQYSLSNEDIVSGLTDGRNDGGIDGLYIFVNGHLLQDPASFFWPRASSELDLHVITCKHHDTFRQSTLDNVAASLTELLDLSKEVSALKSNYNEDILAKREFLRFAYRRVSPYLVKFTIHISYASRGDSSKVGESIAARGDQIKELCSECFNGCSPIMQFIGSAELIESNRRKPNFSLELPFQEVLTRGERYVLLTRLLDYKQFITDSTGKLRRYLFDSNVRDFMGLNAVNDDIKTTLDNSNSPDFWWLNNGVTILATKAIVVGKTIHISDIQIVNGLQTTESIYKYFAAGGLDPNERSLLVKVIVSEQSITRDAIIRATNNQTTVEQAALRATDKIQRDIEDILIRSGLYYERRTNHYLNQGFPENLRITPLYLAAGYISLVLKDISRGSNLRSRFMRFAASYQQVFSPEVSIAIWPVIATVLKRVDECLEASRHKQRGLTEKFLKRWRYILAYIVVSRLSGKLDFSSSELTLLKLDKLDDKLIDDTWNAIKSSSPATASQKKVLSNSVIFKIIQETNIQFSLPGYDNLLARLKASFNYSFEDKRKRMRLPIDGPTEVIDDEFVLKVMGALPPQPWKTGMHRIVAHFLECTEQKLSLAIERLINEDQLYRQRNGVLFDKAGDIVGYDEERVDPLTMTLIDPEY